MNILDLASLLTFTLIVFISGIAFSRSSNSIKNFFAAGGSVPWGISGLSLFMSFFSVGTFVVWGSIAYEKGLIAITIQTCICVAGFAVGTFIAPKWNRRGVLTVAEFIGQRMGHRIKNIYSIIFLFISLFTAGAFLYPVGKIIEVSTGIPLQTSIIILGMLVIIYTALGGLWAVLVTDVLQFVVLTIAVLILVPLAFGEIGGVSTFFDRAPKNFFNIVDDEYSLSFMIAFALYNLVFIGGNWAYVQRYTSVSSPKSAKKVGLLFGCLYLVSPIIWMLPPMIYRIVQPELPALENEGAYLLMAKQALPAGLIGLIVGGMVFATASSVNTTLNISAGVFTNDLFRHIRPNTSDKKNMRVARIATVLFGVFSIAVALSVEQMGGIVSVVLSLAALTGGALYLPTIWALFSYRINGVGLLLASIISLSVNLFFKLGGGQYFGIDSLSRAQEMMLGIIGPLVVLTIMEIYFWILGKDKNDATQNMVNQQDSVSEQSSNNEFGIKVISLGILAIGILVTILGLVTNTGSSITTFMGILVSSLIMFHFIYRYQCKIKVLRS